MKILVTYDGTLNSKDALIYGIEKIRQSGGSLFVLYVFNRNIFLDYEGGPEAERVARSEAKTYIDEARKIIDEMGKGLNIQIIEEEGIPEEEIIRFVSEEDGSPKNQKIFGGKSRVDLILTTPHYKSINKKAPCPVSIIPGIILMPVDSTDNYEIAIPDLIREAKATHSRVLLLGIVPVHLYSRSERKELKVIKNETLKRLKKAKQSLIANGLDVREILREGFVDEEILKAAQEYEPSMIIIPKSTESPSELNKAAEIISNEEGLLKAPLILSPSLIPHACVS
jgi:nucleotide-binding universal stress UspA family protein